MSTDKRMLFIQNIEDLKKGDVESTISEYEVIADTEIVGVLKYDPYNFMPWEVSNKQEGEERKLLLQIHEKVKSNEEQSTRAANGSAFYHGGDIADELVALSSLFLRRRLKLGPIVRMDEKPLLLKMTYRIDEYLIRGSSNLENVGQWLKLVEGLDHKYHLRFILAVKLYHQALLIIENYPDIAYLNLVSAIEVLCQDTVIEDEKLVELDSNLAELVDSVEDIQLRQKIECHILNRERFINRKFASFILSHIDDDFWKYKGRSQTARIEPDELPELLKRIYDQRSRTLHAGEPFPIAIFLPPSPIGAEKMTGLALASRGKLWKKKDFIPYPHFFERLVNFVLKTFLLKTKL